MKNAKAKEDLSEYYQRIGQEFLDSFKKLPYNEDRIGQSFVMKISPKSKLKEGEVKPSEGDVPGQ